MFIDIQHECSLLKGSTAYDRIAELRVKIPDCSIAMVGGFPITRHNLYNNSYFWCGSLVTPERLQAELLKGLGASAVLTYMNPNKKSLKDLGYTCKKREHTWAYHWLNVSLLFCNQVPEVELAFTRDSRFYMSWPVGQGLGQVFMATGSLKSWIKFCGKRNSADFPPSVTDAMGTSSELLRKCFEVNS